MKIITCFKLVPEEQDITVTPEHSLNFDRAEAKISQFDLNAIEAAAQLAGDGDEIAALTVGGSLLQNSKVRKDVLSRGPDALFMVQDAQLEHALPKETALALASAAEKIGFDLLLFGEGSGDIYAQQVGLLTGELLKLPVINAVSHIQRDGDKIIVERTLEEDVEIIELTLPAVLCVMWGGNYFCTDRRCYKLIVKSTTTRPMGDLGILHCAEKNDLKMIFLP